MAAAIALPILTLLAYRYHRATHRRRCNGILCSPHSTRRLSGDMPGLAAEAQRRLDTPRMILSQFEELCSPVIQLSFMFFWRPLVYVSDMPWIEGRLRGRLRWFDKCPGHIRPVMPGSSLAKVQDPKWRAQVRLQGDLIPVAVLDTMRHAISWADTTCGAFLQPGMDGFHQERWLRADGPFDAKALPRWATRTGTKSRVSVRTVLALLAVIQCAAQAQSVFPPPSQDQGQVSHWG